jgi:hypothetical protein
MAHALMEVPVLSVNVVRVKPSEVETLRAWMAEAKERSEEVLETFRNEGVLAEQFHLLETSDGPLMIVGLVVEDADVASAAFAASELPIDLEHRAVMEQVLDGRVEIEELLGLTLPDET